MEKRVQILLGKKKKWREKKRVDGGGGALMGLFLVFLMLSVLRGYCENLSYSKKNAKKIVNN